MILAFNFSECCGRSHRPNPKRTVQAPQTWGQYTCRSDIHLSIGRALMRVSSSARKTSSGTASPPDVRRWLGPAGALHLATGCAPGAGLALLCVRWTCLRISMQQNSEARAPTSASVSLKKITRLANRGSNPHQGHSPVTQPAKRRSTAHRRTSGGEAVPNPARSPSLRQVYWSANLLVWKADPVPALTTKTRIAQTNNSNQSHDDILPVGCNALQCLHFK